MEFNLDLRDRKVMVLRVPTGGGHRLKIVVSWATCLQ